MAGMTAVFKLTATGPDGAKRLKEVSTHKAAISYAEQAQRRGYDVLVEQIVEKDGEVIRKDSFIELPAKVREPWKSEDEAK